MLKLATTSLRFAATSLFAASSDYWTGIFKDRYDMAIGTVGDISDLSNVLRQTYFILRPVPANLIKACGVVKLLLRSDMGPSKPYYPNHGYFDPSTLDIALNVDMFYNPDFPDDFTDHRGYFLTRAQQTLIHELGHAYDHQLHDISLQPEWMSLSGWSKEPQPGLKRLIIREPGAPEVMGEHYYRPDAEFCRFYSSRNSYDDFADAFGYYVAGLKTKVPSAKRAYFDKLLKAYY
jgi:hypothetical protein